MRATRAVRDWLVDSARPTSRGGRRCSTRRNPTAELDARIEALHAFGPGTDEHLMGDLLGYWRRERRVVAADACRLSIADENEQMESPAVITRLTYRGSEAAVQRQDRQAAEVAVGALHVPAATDRRRTSRPARS